MKPPRPYGLLLTCTTLASGLVPSRGLSTPDPIPGPVWEAVAPLPHGLAGFAHGVVAARLVVAGGTRWDHEVKHTLADTLCYDPAMNRWTAGKALSRRFAFGPFGVHDEQLVLFGGDDGERTRADGLAGAIDRTLPEPVAYAGSAVMGGKLYVLGGTTDVRTLARTTDHFLCVDLITGDSAALPPFPGGAAIHVALVAMGADLLAFTGGRWGPSEQRLTNTDGAWRYSSVARRWTPIASFPSPIRGVAACALDDRHVLLAGGYQAAGPTAACFLYDAVENSYRPLPPLPVAALLVGLVKAGDFVYAIGGEDRAKHRSAAVYRSPIAALLTAAGAGAPDRTVQP